MNTSIFCTSCANWLHYTCDDRSLLYCTNCRTYIKITPKPNIVVGDIVQLKSGSIKMTVCTIEKEEAHCRWYDSDFQFIRLPLAALVKI